MPIHAYFKVFDAARRAKAFAARVDAPDAAYSWTFPALLAAYDWPRGLAGGGVIGIVELGGQWYPDDAKAFFGKLGQPVPSIVTVPVGGVEPTPDPNGSDVEVALDYQVAGAAYYAATGKPATIRVYFASTDADGIASGVAAAAADGCDVISISWGADEAEWGRKSAQAMEAAAAAALAKGALVFAAAGDNDSSDGGSSPANVDCPASCPSVIGCGGTHKIPAREIVWNDKPGAADGEGTGGGYSTIFAAQAWQLNARQGVGRMVPDVAADAAPATGYDVCCNGAWTVVGGTSAVAPLYAGLFAAFGRKLGAIAGGAPAATARLYQAPGCFTDIVKGNNGQYSAGPGPDPCTGLGSPLGAKLAALFAQAPTPAPAPPEATPARTQSPTDLNLWEQEHPGE